MILLSKNDNNKIDKIIEIRGEGKSRSLSRKYNGSLDSLLNNQFDGFQGYYNIFIEQGIYYLLFEKNEGAYYSLLFYGTRFEYYNNLLSVLDDRSQCNGKRHYLGLVRSVVLGDSELIKAYFHLYPNPSKFKLKGWNADINSIYYFYSKNISKVEIILQLDKAIETKSQSKHFKLLCICHKAIIQNDKEKLMDNLLEFSKLHMKLSDNKHAMSFSKFLNWELMLILKFATNAFKDFDLNAFAYVDYEIISKKISNYDDILLDFVDAEVQKFTDKIFSLDEMKKINVNNFS